MQMQIVKKLNSVKQLTDTFIRTDNGYSGKPKDMLHR